MHCSDLERYLEAHLDGRLGRNRTAIMQRHLAQCSGCRKRIAQLRDFEKDLHARFRTMQATAALWETLEVNLVTTGTAKTSGIVSESRPSEPPQIRDRSAKRPLLGLSEAPSRFQPDAVADEVSGTDEPRPARSANPKRRLFGAGLAVLAICIGGAFAIDHYRLVQLENEVAALAPAAGLALSTDDPFILRDWFRMQLGRTVPPLPSPLGYELVGGNVAVVEGAEMAIATYDSPAGPVLLYIDPQPGPRRLEAVVSNFKSRGMLAESWNSNGFGLAVISGPDGQHLGRFRAI